MAVLDSGIDVNHPDLAASLWTNPGEAGEAAGNGRDDDGNGLVDDVHGWDFVHGDNSVYDPEDFDPYGGGEEHGTHVAGIIAAALGNGGIVGVAPGVRIMPLKVCSQGLCSDSAIIQAIQYAKAKRARVANASWGGGPDSPALREAIRDSGMVFVAAAGNGGADGVGDDNDAVPFYPASYTRDLPNVLAVTAIDNRGGLAGFANYGASSVDVAAPGVGMADPYAGLAFAFRGDGYDFLDSMSDGSSVSVGSYVQPLYDDARLCVLWRDVHGRSLCPGRGRPPPAGREGGQSGLRREGWEA